MVKYHKWLICLRPGLPITGYKSKIESLYSNTAEQEKTRRKEYDHQGQCT